MKFITKSITIALGISVFGISSYLVYLLLKKDEDDDYFNALAKTSKYKTIEIRIPRDVVRTLIGRNGRNIKMIEEQSNAKINFKGSENAKEQVCVIRGSVEACSVAENLVRDVISSQPIVEVEDLWIPQNVVSKLAGRNGDKMFEISSLSGAKLTIVDEDNGATTKRINIRGTKEQIRVAKSLLEDIIEQCRQSQLQLETTLAKREPRLPPKSPNSPKQFESPKVERISPIPGQSDAPFEVYVSAMVNPSRFWIQIVGPKATELDLLVEEMSEYYGKPENKELHVLDTVNEGDLVAAVFQYDNKWYRAEVLKINDISGERIAELYFVDYGDTDAVPCKELYELRTDFLRLHFQAIECYLARVEPIGEDWSEDAVDKFEEWTHVARWQKLSAKINGYCVREKTRAKREGSPVPGVDLYDVNNEQDIDIAQELVNHGYAVFKKDFDLRSSRATSVSNVSVASNP